MSLKKIWTSQYQRYGRAAYAETNDQYIDVIMADIIALMQVPGSRFYKVEVKEDGAYVGYFIVNGHEVVKYHMRPQFVGMTAQFNALMAEVKTNVNYSSTIGSDNIQ